jgi:type IV pilus biogenesis protein CpaD/CtpE
MRRIIILFSLLTLIMTGCAEKPIEPDFSGTIIDIDKRKRILVDDKANGQIWVNIEKLDTKLIPEKNSKVDVWIDGPILESYTAQGTAKKVNILK